MGHPYRCFLFVVDISFFVKGNKKSLMDAVEKGVDLRQRIMKMYEDNYYGEFIKLVLIGGGRVFCFYLMYYVLISCYLMVVYFIIIQCVQLP